MTWQLLILEKEPPIILRWPQKCSQVTGKTIKGRNPKVQFFWDTLCVISFSYSFTSRSFGLRPERKDQNFISDFLFDCNISNKQQQI